MHGDLTSSKTKKKKRYDLTITRTEIAQQSLNSTELIDIGFELLDWVVEN